MKRLFFVSGLTVLLSLFSPLEAAEVPHLEFVRGLRDRQFSDLALEYLDKLRANPPSPEVAALIPLETAKVRLDLARLESSSNRRLELYNKARADLEEFTKKNPESPLVAEARLVTAQVAGSQAKTILSRALHQENPTLALGEAATARQMFADARKPLTDLAAQLHQRLAEPKYANPSTTSLRSEKRTLEQARLQAELDLGLNYIDQAQTFIDESNVENLQQRAAVIKQAIPIFDKLGTRDPRNPICWQAQAWAAHCYHQNGDPRKARTKLQDVIDQTDASAAAGQRLARYFRLLIVADNPEKSMDGPNPVATLRDGAERWLNDYRRFVNYPEGQGVRYLLARACIELAGQSRDQQVRLENFQRARQLCRELERVENDFTEKALSLTVRIVREQGGFKKEIDKLPTFDDCLVRAQYEAAQINELAKKKDIKPEELDKERKIRLQAVIAALRRGLTLAADKFSRVLPSEVSRARTMLAGYYLFTQRYQEAIQEGEQAARARPPTSQSALVAIYVLEAYSELIASSLQEGTPIADLEQECKGLRDLADYMEATWPSEPAGDRARHLRGLLLIREKKPAEAVEALARVSPSYGALVFARYQLAQAALQAAQDRAALARTEPDPTRRKVAADEERKFEDRAVAALQSLPPLPPGADDLTTLTFFKAQVELGRLLYRLKSFGPIENMVPPLLAGLDKGEFHFDKPQGRAEVRTDLVIVLLFAKYGQAMAEFNSGNLDKVRAITTPVVEAIKKGEYAELKKNPELRWGLMGLALRTEIQQGNTAKAQEILQTLQKFPAEEGGGSQVVIQQLALLVRNQVQDIRKKKDKALLDKTVASFSSFLAELGKQQKDPSPELLRTLAEAYASLDLHDQALDFAHKVTEPREEGGQPADPRKVANYRAARLLELKELRLAGKLDQAEALLGEIQQTSWAKEYLETEKERIHLTAARGKLAAAYLDWNKLVGALVRKIRSQPGAKDQYFECYFYLTECYFKYAQGLADEAKRDEAIRRAASFITRLEGSWPDLGGPESRARFEDLLERAPVLKEQYDKLKSGSR
jgi:hypothetical protein